MEGPTEDQNLQRIISSRSYSTTGQTAFVYPQELSKLRRTAVMEEDLCPTPTNINANNDTKTVTGGDGDDGTGTSLLRELSFKIKSPDPGREAVSIMRFKDAGVNPAKWTGCKMIRDVKRRTAPPPPSSKLKNAMREEKTSAVPAVGAGSEYVHQQQQLQMLKPKRQKLQVFSRKKGIGTTADQPWLVKLTDDNVKSRMFRGVKEGGISDHASYYCFIQLGNGSMEAVPVNNWFDFKAVQRYQNLTLEEAEERFERRNKMYDYFSVMTRKRLHGQGQDKEEDDIDEENQPSSPKTSRINAWSSEDEEDDKRKKTGRQSPSEHLEDDHHHGETGFGFMSSSSNSCSSDAEGSGKDEPDDHGNMLNSLDSDSEERSNQDQTIS